MLNKEDILALVWEHSEGSGERYTFTEESLFAFLKELKKEPAPAQDEPVGIIQAIDGLEGEDPDEFKEVDVWVDLPVGTKLYATRPAQTAPNSDCEWCAGAGKDHFGEKCEHCQTAPQPEQSGLVEALEEIASGLQAEFAWEVAEQALAAYRAALAAQQTNKI